MSRDEAIMLLRALDRAPAKLKKVKIKVVVHSPPPPKKKNVGGRGGGGSSIYYIRSAGQGVAAVTTTAVQRVSHVVRSM